MARLLRRLVPAAAIAAGILFWHGLDPVLERARSVVIEVEPAEPGGQYLFLRENPPDGGLVHMGGVTRMEHRSWSDFSVMFVGRGPDQLVDVTVSWYLFGKRMGSGSARGRAVIVERLGGAFGVNAPEIKDAVAEARFGRRWQAVALESGATVQTAEAEVP